jgi:hypothetical protein
MLKFFFMAPKAISIFYEIITLKAPELLMFLVAVGPVRAGLVKYLITFNFTGRERALDVQITLFL